MNAPAPVPVFFLSDSTGISAETMGNALLIQFPELTFERRLIPFITSVAEARRVVAVLDEAAGGPVTPMAFSTTAAMYPLNEGSSASPNATALAATTCISGPPCSPGNTAELNFFANASSFVMIMPPRGPRSALWVVQVTTSAKGTGDGTAWPATKPMTCAASTRR